MDARQVARRSEMPIIRYARRARVWIRPYGDSLVFLLSKPAWLLACLCRVQKRSEFYKAGQAINDPNTVPVVETEPSGRFRRSTRQCDHSNVTSLARQRSASVRRACVVQASTCARLQGFIGKKIIVFGSFRKKMPLKWFIWTSLRNNSRILMIQEYLSVAVWPTSRGLTHDLRPNLSFSRREVACIHLKSVGRNARHISNGEIMAMRVNPGHLNIHPVRATRRAERCGHALDVEETRNARDDVQNRL